MKRALAAVLALAALAASVLPWESEARDRRCRPARNGGRTGDCVSYAFFEAFPTSGAGTTSACSTTAPTGAKGEALTFTRASTAYCTATASGGLATTNIQTGDLVSVSNNVARQEYDSAGVLGLRVEGSRTNYALYSQQFDNAVYTYFSVGGPVSPVLVSINNTGPDGQATAERISFAACPNANSQSIIYQPVTVGATSTHSVYAKAVSGAPSISVCGAGTGAVCVACVLNSVSWTRCTVPQNGATTNIVIGCNNYSIGYSGASNTGAADVYLWNAQSEAGLYATSPILTTTAAQTRAAELASFDLGAGNGPKPNGASMAISVTSNSTTKSGSVVPGAVSLSAAFPYVSDATIMNFASPGTSGSTWRCNGTNNATTGFVTGSVAGTASFRGWCSASGVVNGALDAASMTTGASQTGTFDATRYVAIGSNIGYAGSQIDGVVSRACVDPDPTRCR